MGLTYDEIDANKEFAKYSRDLIIKILSQNDKALVANLLDFSKKIIIDIDSLRELIQVGLGEKRNIDILSNIEEKSCKCGSMKVKIGIFEDILTIHLNGTDFKVAEPVLYDYIEKELNISLSRTYCKKVISISKAEEKARDRAIKKSKKMGKSKIKIHKDEEKIDGVISVDDSDSPHPVTEIPQTKTVEEVKVNENKKEVKLETQ